MKSEKITLRDGRRIELRGLRARENMRTFRNFVNALVKEKAYIARTTLISLKAEREWLKKTLKRIRKGDKVWLGAFYENRIVGSCDASKGEYDTTRRNISLALGVAGDFRRAGLGQALMQRVIALAKKRLNPRIIYLTHAGANKPARVLYEKIGFREVARLPKWRDYYGTFQDEVYMVLKK